MSRMTTKESKAMQRRTLAGLVAAQPFECGVPEAAGGVAASSGGGLLALRIIKRLRVSANPPRWLYYCEQVVTDADYGVTVVDGGRASYNPVLEQAAAVAGAPVLTSPAPGVVLELDGDGTIVLAWEEVDGALGYHVVISSEPDGAGTVYVDEETADDVFTLTVDGADLPGDGTQLYVSLGAIGIEDETINAYTYYAPGSTAHLFANQFEIAAAPEAVASYPAYHADGSRKAKLPAGTIVVPVGGYPPVQRVPAGEPETEWSNAPGAMPIVAAWRHNGAIVFNTPTGLYSECGADLSLRDAEDVSLARLSSPSPGSQLAGETVTFVITGVTGGLEYWLVVRDEDGDTVYFNASLDTDVSVEVTGLTADAAWLRVEVGVRLNRRADYRFGDPAWGWNEYRVQRAEP